MRLPRTIVVALSSFALLVSAVPAAANAATAPAKKAQVVSNAQINAAYRELVKSKFARSIKTTGGETVETFDLTHGTRLSFPVAAVSPSKVHPGVTGGYSPTKGFYVELNRVDQGAIAVGLAAGVAAAICVIPAVGWAVCGAVALILAVAAYYIASYGVCPNSKPNLRVYAIARYGPVCEKY
jgi:hypothetical protein